MPFATLDEAHEYETKTIKELGELKTSKDGLKVKLEESIQDNKTLQSEVNRLKIKNYEYYEMLQSESNTQDKKQEEPSPEFSINDIAKDFK